MDRIENRVIKYGILLDELASSESAFSVVAKILIKKIYNHEKITKATQIADESDVSNATITKFVKSLGFNNFNELALIHNSSLVTKEKEIQISNEDIFQAVKLIENSHKIFFVGVSNSYIINEDFGSKLLRMDKWVILTPSKYEQVGLSKLLTEKDLLIINSISLQHAWMSEIAKKTKAKIIVLTTVNQNNLKFKPDLYFEIKSPERNDLFRIVTIQNRNETLKIYDQIIEGLLKNDENFKKVEISSYRNIINK